MESLRSTDTLRIVPSTVAPAAESTAAEPVWSPLKKILFRWTCAYFFLYIFPFPLDAFPYVAYAVQPYAGLWNDIVPWVGKHVFKVAITVLPNGSGDTTYNYVQVFCFAVLAALATVVWSLLDRKRANYVRLNEWLRVYVTFSLAMSMISYGAIKVIKSQFPSATLDRLVQPFGDASPMGLLWTFMGATMAYSIFAGAAEMLGGLLLTTRRTRLLGGLVSIAVVSNIVMLNYAFDVPVKLYSSHLLVMGIFVIVPDLRRLMSFFVLNRPAAAVEFRPLFARPGLNRGALIFRALFVVGYTGLALYGAQQGRQTYGDLAPRSTLRGVWTVEEMVVNGTVRPPVFTDATRWRRMVFDYKTGMSIYTMNDSRRRFNLKLGPAQKTMILTKREDPKASSTFTYQQPGPGLLTVTGTMDGETIQAKLRRADEKSFLLTSRGFHWINEYPFNR
jgi:hypothetical protein